MVIPVGDAEKQDLLLVKKDLSGNLHIETQYTVSFVEFKGEYGWNQGKITEKHINESEAL